MTKYYYFNDVEKVRIRRDRWDAYIVIIFKNGKTKTFRASADGAFLPFEDGLAFYETNHRFWKEFSGEDWDANNYKIRNKNR